MTSPTRGPREEVIRAVARRVRREAAARYRTMGLIALAVIAADQIVKAIIRATIRPGETIEVLPGIDLANTLNRGIAFGLFPGNRGLVAVLTLVAIAVIATLLVGFAGRHGLVPIGGGLLVGGSLGNLIDRIAQGGVTDYIAIGAWPPFNVADIGVVTGAALLVLAIALSGSDE